MANLVLGPLLDVIVQKLASPVLDKCCLLSNLKDNIKTLQLSLPRIQKLLQDAQKQQLSQKAIHCWLMKLKDVAYESEDLLDELLVEVTMYERTSGRERAAGLLSPFKISSHLFELASELQKKLEELDRIADKGFSFSLQQAATEKPAGSLPGRTKEKIISVDTSDTYGRDDDLKYILSFLVSEKKGKATKGLPVISIVGIGGIGKTTLARHAYEDEKVNNHFELKKWIHVSENFDVSKMMINIINSPSTSSPELCGSALLQSQVKDSLSGKRFLLVLDDVWNEDQGEWQTFSHFLRDGAEGSRVLVTTRSTTVATITGTEIFPLKRLSDEHSWNLFEQWAFRERGESETRELVPIGKEIISKCGGIPLAAITLGRLLRFKNKEYWMSVQDSELWNLKECETAILPALKLSYLSLKPYQQRCFAFCSLFPKNRAIYRKKTIYIWMAQGLIEPDGGSLELEDVGSGYFDDLLSLFFFERVQEDNEVGPEVYKMHDLLHDLARTIGGSDFAILGQGLARGDLKSIRHLSIVYNVNPSSLPEDLFEARHLRTWLMFPGYSSDDSTSFLPVSFVYLRVLDFGGCGLKSLDESIGTLICLRYLDLSINPIQSLPRTVCSLCYLQTLNLFKCQNLMELPLEVANLKTLRHLDITGCEALDHMPPMIGKLVQLQTLPLYIVGERPSESIAQLQFLNLRDELHIKRMENVRDANEAKIANMRAKKHLRSLKLQWGCSNGGMDLTPAKGTSTLRSLSFPVKEDEVEDVEIILKHLEPNGHLNNLHVKGYPGRKFPEWNLPNLTMIELNSCRRCLYLPRLGHLLSLERLHLQGMNDITHIDKAFYGGASEPFPSLKYLVIRDFPHLLNWSSIVDGVPFRCLEQLVLDKCPELISAPPFHSIRNLELRHCNARIMEYMKNKTSLSSLVIDNLPQLEHLSGKFLENNKSLEYLEISSCQKLHDLPLELENLIALKSLIISCCEKLSDLPHGIHKLKSLELLEINGCHSLTFLPNHETKGLSSLKTLSIENCLNLSSFSSDIHRLTALEHLSVMSCPELTSFPDGFQTLVALRSLSIISCPKLAYLPESLKHATTLESLVIHSCEGLTALPEWFRRFSCLRSLAISYCWNIISLPEGLRCLTALQHISIQDCPILEEHFKGNGREWQKIAHIPHIYIGPPKSAN